MEPVEFLLAFAISLGLAAVLRSLSSGLARRLGFLSNRVRGWVAVPGIHFFPTFVDFFTPRQGELVYVACRQVALFRG